MITRTLFTLAATLTIATAMGQDDKTMQDAGSMRMGMRAYDQADLNKWGNDSMWFKDAMRTLTARDQVLIIAALNRLPSNQELTLRRVIKQGVAEDSNFDHSSMTKKDSSSPGMIEKSPSAVWDTTMRGLSKYDQKTLAHTWENLLPSERQAFLNFFGSSHERHMMWNMKMKG